MNAFAMSAVILVTVIVKGLLTLRDECFRSKHQSNLLWIKHNLQAINLIRRLIYGICVNAPILYVLYIFKMLGGVQFWLPACLLALIDGFAFIIVFKFACITECVVSGFMKEKMAYELDAFQDLVLKKEWTQQNVINSNERLKMMINMVSKRKKVDQGGSSEKYSMPKSILPQSTLECSIAEQIGEFNGLTNNQNSSFSTLMLEQNIPQLNKIGRRNLSTFALMKRGQRGVPQFSNIIDQHLNDKQSAISNEDAYQQNLITVKSIHKRKTRQAVPQQSLEIAVNLTRNHSSNTGQQLLQLDELIPGDYNNSILSKQSSVNSSQLFGIKLQYPSQFLNVKETRKAKSRRATMLQSDSFAPDDIRVFNSQR
ncbi:hypothetical protein FGO68_gene5496 [Halteria grandinella]|uniref:Uncharacterized protein n=1 Tax=Halteria grandinella TaxID=5974 RepID=A0A8J8NQA8_HALGN|nr:hypothetical protein FGO68_gene5496 [Halteria grandinella]